MFESQRVDPLTKCVGSRTKESATEDVVLETIETCRTENKLLTVVMLGETVQFVWSNNTTSKTQVVH